MKNYHFDSITTNKYYTPYSISKTERAIIVCGKKYQACKS